MEQIASIIEDVDKKITEFRQVKENYLKNLRAILYGKAVVEAEDSADSIIIENDTPIAKKRAKHLSVLTEDEGEASSVLTKSKKSNTALLADAVENDASSTRKSPRHKTRTTAALETTNTVCNENNLTATGGCTAAPVTETKSALELMPPPAVPVSAFVSDQSFARPQRAAKVNCEKNLKEPTLNHKLRRPAGDEVRVKLEHEQRASQMHESISNNKKATYNDNEKSRTVAPTQSEQELQNSQSSEVASHQSKPTRQLSIRIKREKLSDISGLDNMASKEARNKTQKETTAVAEISTSVFSTTTATTVSNTTNDTIRTKKGSRKKKPAHKPIKVERFSDADGDGDADELSPPIASRTRKGNSFEKSKNKSLEKELITEENQLQQNVSVYEEAWEAPPTVEIPKTNVTEIKTTKIVNETITVVPNSNSAATPTNATMVLGAAPTDSTFCTAAAATFVVDAQNTQASGGAAAACSDLTFDIAPNKNGCESQRSSEQSMATARDTLQPRAESLITEDESDTGTPVAKVAPASNKLSATNATKKMHTQSISASKKMAFPPKHYKKPVREIFNPLIQSPVKKKVEAYENVAAASKNSKLTRSQLTKENSTPSSLSSSTTPIIGKLNSASNTGRFLTPTQSSNLITPNVMAHAKKQPASASKVIGLIKSSSAGNLRGTASAKAPSRENSAEDMRRGILQLNEERKKQREQKHLQAAQQREAKERERAERMAKAAKEREEKALKKKQIVEQKQRELQEIQRKLKQQEEEAAQTAAAEAAAQKEKLIKLNQQQGLAANGNSKARMMMPPQPKNKYTFEMLHEDDSTDEETKVTYKRPPPPTWSLSHVRVSPILDQQHVSPEIIDSFFSVKPITLDLKKVFPTIDARNLKRNSSAIWQTPPRYSELPKY